MKKVFLLNLVICFFNSGCEKTIDFQLQNSSPKIVVDARIENNKPPIVILSRSLGYFSNIDSQVLASSFVHNAVVTISNGSKTQSLKEYAFSLQDPRNTFYYYSIDSANLANSFLGQLNKTYELKIRTNNKEYNASTTIPSITKKIDSLLWKTAPAQNDATKVVVIVKATDPAGFGDYVRYFTKRNSEVFLPPFNSVFDDLVIDGTSYQLQVEPGVDRNKQNIGGENFFSRGDTVTLKLCNIDKYTFDFWRTMEYSYNSIGNPFATPVKVLGNISNDALGYFGGYACQYHTIIIPK